MPLAFVCISMLLALLCNSVSISMHFCCISMHSYACYAFSCISVHSIHFYASCAFCAFHAFLCILCISMHFYAFCAFQTFMHLCILYISMHFVPRCTVSISVHLCASLCISMPRFLDLMDLTGVYEFNTLTGVFI